MGLISLALIGILVMYIPFFIALARGHKNKVAIFFLVTFLGWTFLGWVVALIWGLLKQERKVVYVESGVSCKV